VPEVAVFSVTVVPELTFLHIAAATLMTLMTLMTLVAVTAAAAAAILVVRSTAVEGPAGRCHTAALGARRTVAEANQIGGVNVVVRC
jgi:hypothetical protein